MLYIWLVLGFLFALGGIALAVDDYKNNKGIVADIVFGSTLIVTIYKIHDHLWIPAIVAMFIYVSVLVAIDWIEHLVRGVERTMWPPTEI